MTVGDSQQFHPSLYKHHHVAVAPSSAAVWAVRCRLQLYLLTSFALSGGLKVKALGPLGMQEPIHICGIWL